MLLKFLCSVLLIIGISGCASFFAYQNVENDIRHNDLQRYCHNSDSTILYGGTYTDIRLIAFPVSCNDEECFGDVFYPGLLIIGIVDLPFSFVLDSFLLPATIPASQSLVCRKNNPELQKKNDSAGFSEGEKKHIRVLMVGNDRSAVQ